MVNGHSVVAVFLVFTVLADDGLAFRSAASPFRSLQSQVRFVNGECQFGYSRMDRGYVTLKDGRCFEASCAPGSNKATFTLVARCPAYYDKYCQVMEDVFAEECCKQPVLCQ